MHPGLDWADAGRRMCDGATMKKCVVWIVAAVLFLTLGFFAVVPRLARTRMGAGSYMHAARLWRNSIPIFGATMV